jgi:photosystem II stability/assembly factor-like uncharacterized protein
MRVLSAVGLSLALALPLAAQAPAAAPTQPDVRQLSALRWRNVGPFRAGRVASVSGVIGEPGTFYAAFPGGGIWKTTSAGMAWTPIFDGVREVSSVGAVEVAPSDPRVVYAGTGDMMTGGVADYGRGMYKSTDAGKSWQPIGLEGSRHIQSLSVDPRDANVVLVGALGPSSARSEVRGVFRSTDGGAHWSRTLFVDDVTGIAKLARAFDQPNVVFAATMSHYAGPDYADRSIRSWQLGSVKIGGDTTTRTQLWKSVDGGATWTRLAGTGLPRLTGRLGIAVAQGTLAQRVYVIGGEGLYRSDDGGATWRTMAADDERIRNGQGGYSCGVWVDPRNPDIVYTINTAAYKSTDGGRTFTGFKGAPGGDDPQQLWIDPTDGRRMLMGLDQGAIVSLDGGQTWSSWYNQSTEQLYHVAVDGSWPYWIYATQQDAGAIRTRARGNLGAVTMFDWNPVNGWEWGTVLPDPTDPRTVWASGNGLVKIRYPSEQWINMSPAIDPALKARQTSDQPLVFTPWDKRQLLLGLQAVYATRDGGATWRALSGDLASLPGMDSATLARTPGGRGGIMALDASPVGRGTIWVGTNNGMIHVTRDGGLHWANVSIAGLPEARHANVSSLSASPFEAGTAYAAIEYLRRGDATSYVYRTRDFGATWTRITTGLPADPVGGGFARVVKPDPVRRGLLYLGTESGLYVSFDDGDHWQSLQQNLPAVPVRDLAFARGDLVIATHGRGLWVLDDIAPLRQLAATPAPAVTLYTPSPAVRMRRNVGWNTPLPPDLPHAENPPEGVIVDYALARDADAVTLEVLDATGGVIRRLSSAPIAPVAEAARPPHPNFWIGSPLVLPASAGHHRAQWDLRREAPRAFEHSFEINANPGLTPASPEGPLVPPGRYTLRLTANGATATAVAVVEADPRADVPVAALRAQGALGAELTALANRAHDERLALDSLRARVAAAGTGAALVAAIDSLEAGGRRAARPGLKALNATFVAQLMAQDNGDHAPTAAMRAAAAGACRDLVKAIGAAQALRARAAAALPGGVPAREALAPPRC